MSKNLKRSIPPKSYDEFENIHVNSIPFTDCKGKRIEPIFLEKNDLVTVTVCGTEKTPCPKRATYSNANSILKFESYTNHY